MKLAIIYDRVNKFGGAERVLLALHEIWPEAPLFTAVYDKNKAKWADAFEIKTTFLQKIPFAKTHHELLPFLTPLAFSKLDLSEFDVILSVTSAEAKFVKKSPLSRGAGAKRPGCVKNQIHICYCLTPTRYLWSHRDFYQSQGISGKILKLFAKSLQKKDLLAAKKVDHFIAISNEIKTRIKKYYYRNSIVIYPPVGISTPLIKRAGESLDSAGRFKTSQNISKPFYLIVSRLVPYKRINLAIKACNKLKKNLVIIGKGSQEKYLKSISGKTIKFKGHLTDRDIKSYYKQCRALIFPGEEDFGIVPVEAQSYGKPVIAFAKGGALETVIDNKTGILFTKQTEKSLLDAILKFEKINKKIKSSDCINNAKNFSKEKFQSKIKKAVKDLYKNHL